jgi:1-acyl-sn-glycerol-3-phosphate acyltransferase
MPMLPPAPIRRLLLVPLVIVIAAALVVLTPAVALLSAAYNLIRRRRRPGRVRQSRLLRVAILGLAWSIGETAALTVSLGLWIASGFGGHLDTEPYRTRNYAVMRWFLDLVYRVASRACGLKVTVSGPANADTSVDRPVIVLSRHAGPGDSLLLVHHLLSVYDRRPRVVMKASLQLDPSVDILANRVPNAFLRRAKKVAAASQPAKSRYDTEADSQRAEQIRRLAAGLDQRGALLLFPEGGNWTPLRWRRGVQRLRLRGRDDLAKRAAAMHNLLPPHPTGVIAAITACPAADVIFVAHAGLDRLVSVRDVWHSLLGDLEVQARWWRVPAADVPRTASREDQVSWLYDWWERLDAWIGAQHQSEPDVANEAPADEAPADEAAADEAPADEAAADEAAVNEPAVPLEARP